MICESQFQLANLWFVYLRHTCLLSSCIYIINCSRDQKIDCNLWSSNNSRPAQARWMNLFASSVLTDRQVIVHAQRNWVPPVHQATRRFRCSCSSFRLGPIHHAAAMSYWKAIRPATARIMQRQSYAATTHMRNKRIWPQHWVMNSNDLVYWWLIGCMPMCKCIHISTFCLFVITWLTDWWMQLKSCTVCSNNA